jgi:hypothetical protein
MASEVRLAKIGNLVCIATCDTGLQATILGDDRGRGIHPLSKKKLGVVGISREIDMEFPINFLSGCSKATVLNATISVLAAIRYTRDCILS